MTLFFLVVQLSMIHQRLISQIKETFSSLYIKSNNILYPQKCIGVGFECNKSAIYGYYCEECMILCQKYEDNQILINDHYNDDE